MNEKTSHINLNRFGHTSITMSNEKVFIFGGAVENGENSFITTNESIQLHISTGIYKLLQSKIIRYWYSSLSKSSSCNVPN